ncbi:uncharacterized protein LOC113295074 [Papaver somniferum]|uniref:uncharacterized protein LOC113295074 n=1 Tax=Papaver somniferum TaxID=3469 RepID=UPI000E6F84F3|nr:uncharacterized protein LOC113295074 [Papaver somniferum]
MDPNTVDKNDDRYSHYHRRIQHPRMDCYNLRIMLQRKLEIGEIEMGNPEGGKATQHQVMMLSHEPSGDAWKPWEDNDEEACETEMENPAFTNTDGVASRFAQTVLSQQLFDSLDFSENQIKEASKAITAIAAGKPYDPLPKEAIVFTDEDIFYPGEHLRPLYLTTHINKHPLKRAFVYGGASLNLISMHTLDILGVQRSAIRMRTTSVKGFGGHTQTSIGIVNLVMKVGPIRALTPFYILEDDTTFHVLLGRGWLLNHKVVASTYHQCVKTNMGGRKYRIPSTSNPFDPDETYMA